MKLITVPLKNIFGNMGRSLTFGSFIFITILLVTLVYSFLMTAKSNMENCFIYALSGHIQILSSASEEEEMFSFRDRWGKIDYLKGPEIKALEDVLNHNGFPDYVKRVRHNVLFISDTAKDSGMIIGLDSKYPAYRSIFKLTHGRYPDLNNKHEVLLSEDQAEELGVSIGDSVTALAQTKDGYTIDSALTVVGIGKAGMLSAFGFAPAFMGLNGARELRGYDNELSDIIVYIDNKHRADHVVAELQTLLQKNGLMENVKLSTWDNKCSLIIGWINLYKGIFNIFLIFLLAIIVILIINLVTMIGLERRQEIGTLRAIGFSQLKTIFLFMGEVLLITAFFCLSGFVISFVFMSLVGQTGIAVTHPSLSWMTGEIFYPTLGIMQSMLIVAIIFGCSFIASLYPSFRATSLKPAETLKEM